MRQAKERPEYRRLIIGQGLSPHLIRVSITDRRGCLRWREFWDGLTYERPNGEQGFLSIGEGFDSGVRVQMHKMAAEGYWGKRLKTLGGGSFALKDPVDGCWTTATWRSA